MGFHASLGECIFLQPGEVSAMLEPPTEKRRRHTFRTAEFLRKAAVLLWYP